MSDFVDLATEIATVVEQKNKEYGSSFDTCGEFLALLWPNGVPVERYTDMLQLVRMYDKFCRIATGAQNEDAHADLLGYALLGLRKKRRDSAQRTS